MRIYEISYRSSGRGTRKVATLTPDEAPRKLMRELIDELDELHRELVEIEKDIEYNKNMHRRSCIKVQRQPSKKMFFQKVRRKKDEKAYRESKLAQLESSRMRRVKKKSSIESALYRHLCRINKKLLPLK